MFVKLVLGRVADVLDEAADEDDEEALDSELRRWFDVMSMEPLFGIILPFVGHSDDGEIEEDGDVDEEDEIGRSDEFNEARDDVLTPESIVGLIDFRTTPEGSKFALTDLAITLLLLLLEVDNELKATGRLFSGIS